MDPITLGVAAASLINALRDSDSVGFGEAETLQKVIDNISDLFSRSARTCVHRTHECTYREGSCHVLLTKGSGWQIEDIEECPYRKAIAD